MYDPVFPPCWTHDFDEIEGLQPIFSRVHSHHYHARCYLCLSAIAPFSQRGAMHLGIEKIDFSHKIWNSDLAAWTLFSSRVARFTSFNEKMRKCRLFSGGIKTCFWTVYKFENFSNTHIFTWNQCIEVQVGFPIPISNSGIPKLSFNTDSEIQNESIPIFFSIQNVPNFGKI